MNEAWSSERWRFGGTIIGILVIGWVTGNWLLALILPSFSYVFWNLYQLYLFEKWLSTGAKRGKSLETGGIWAVIVQHVSRRERAEKKRKKRYKDVLSRVNTVISALPDAAVVLSENKQIEWSNDSARMLLGIDKSRDHGAFVANLIRDPDFTDFLDNPRLEEELEITSPMDIKEKVSLRLTPFGKKQFLLTAVDISQRVKLRRVRSAFIANASHELRTPLTVISGYLEILQTDPELAESLKQPVSSARDQAVRMESLITDLLTLSRVEGAVFSESEAVSLNIGQMIVSVVRDLEQTVAKGTHEFRLKIDNEVLVRGIEIEIGSVILNLCRNAVLHTPAGSHIDITWKKKSDGRAYMVVRDDGPGIPVEHLSRLSERFYRIDNGRSRAAGGTGLGLSITKHVMERHQGFFSIRSEEGSFAEFEVCFPEKHTC